ncbi:MAG: hypothetical protein U0521_14390 [Anaerolineae bacterium]
MTKIRIIAFPVGAAALISAGISGAATARLGTDHGDGPGDARIDFSIDHNMVKWRSTRVTLRWQVEHIQAVYFEGQPTVGEGLQNLCAYASDQKPQLRRL